MRKKRGCKQNSLMLRMIFVSTIKNKNKPMLPLVYTRTFSVHKTFLDNESNGFINNLML